MTTTVPDAPPADAADRVGATPLTRWIVAVAAVVPALLALLTARFDRPTVGPDAVSYIAVADSLRAGTGLGFHLENPLTTWPPGWPLLLAAGEAITGWRGDLVALGVNCLLLPAVVVAGVLLGARLLERRSVRYVQLAGLAASPLLVGLAILVQTEVAFVLGAAVALVCMLVGIERDRRWWFAVAGAVLAVCFYVRYQAFYAVPILAGWLLVRSWLASRSFRRGFVDACWLAVPAVLPAAAWMIRNLSVSDTVMGPRYPSAVGFPANVAAAFRTLTKFLTSLPEGPAMPMAALGFVAVVVVIATTVLRGRDDGWGPSGSWRAAVIDGFQRPVGLLVTFVVGFSILMAISRSVVGFDDLDLRLLAPLAIPTSLLFLRWVEVVLLDRDRWRTLGRVALGLWLAAQVVVTLLLIGPANSFAADSGYNAARAVRASSSPALDLLPDGCVLYSNNAGDLYRAKIKAQVSPRVVQYQSDERTHQLEDLAKAVDGGQQACLAWVGYTDDDEVYSRDALRKVVDLVELGSADGLTTYRIEPKS